MPVRLWRLLALVFCLAVLGMPSCGAPVTADPCQLPRCDPEGAGETVCSPLDATVATTLDESARFLYEGPAPLQVGVAAGVIAPGRAAVIRGKVTYDDAPVVGAAISIAGHPAYGRTVSRCDGAFDLVVNGGAPLTVSITGEGYLPVRRRVEPRWQSYAMLPEVVLTRADAPVEVDLAEGGVVQARWVSDGDGERRATLLFQPGTVATADGAPLDAALHVRATEYTVGPDGPKKMPASLPAKSGYTYAVEYGIDEAGEEGSVTFNQPVFAYVDNFLGMPVGTLVPAGHYDRQVDMWMPSEDGKVIEVVRVKDGLAEVDSDGDGKADELLGMSDKERAQIASLYGAGKSLWRVPVSHFSSWDFNWPFGPPSDAIAALEALQELLSPEDADGSCKTSGSIIDCQNQILGEAFPVSGTPFALHYTSDRVSGRKAAYQIKLRVLPVAKPASLKRIDVSLQVAGQVIEQHFDCNAPPGCDSTTTATLTWGGKDAYGRTVQGRQPAEVRIGYAYDGVYEAAAPGGFGKEGSGVAINGSLTRQEVSLESVWQGYLGTWRAEPEGLGGFGIDVHHRYDPLSQTVYFGNGEKEPAPRAAQVITLAAGGCLANCNDKLGVGVNLLLPQAVAAAADGSVFIAETNQHRVLRMTPEGFISTVAGTGNLAELNAPEGLAVAADGTLYIADTGNGRIRRLKDGKLSTVAGGDGDTTLGKPVAVAVARDGYLVVADSLHHRLWRVDLGGKIDLFAGTGAYGASGDGGNALDAAIGDPAGLAVDKEGNVYVAQPSSHRVRRISPDRTIEAFAGTGSGGFRGDGSAATSAALNYPRGLAVGSDGSVYIADSYNNRVRRVGPDRIIQTVAGVDLAGTDGDGGPAAAAELNEPRGLALAPDGSLFVGDVSRVRRIAPAAGLPGYTGVGDIVVPLSDGSRLFVFTAQGRHQATRDATTGALLLSFGYTDGLLTSITDSANNKTEIRRSGGGKVEIVSPFGKHTRLSMNTSGAAEGYLRELTNPEEETILFSYEPGGLLSTLTDPKKNQYTFTYDAEGLGRLVLDRDPAGGSKRLTRTEDAQAASYSVDVSTALSVTTSHKLEQLDGGEERRTVTLPDKVAVETVSDPNGHSRTLYADDTIVTVDRAGDPRFGVQAPFAKEMSIATGGKTLRLSMAREAALAAPKDPLSATSLTESVTVNGKTFTRAFDPAARKFTGTTPEGRETYTWLDTQGRVIGVQTKGLARTTLAYDDRGRPWTVTAEHPTTPALSRTYTFEYRATDGELGAVRDPTGAQIAQFDYDKAGRVRSILEPYGAGATRTTSFTYDKNGNVETLTPPGKAAHAFAYTPVDLLRLYTPPAVPDVADRSTAYSLTLDRHLDLTSLPGGELIDVDNDDAGRVKAIRAGPDFAIGLTYVPSSDPRKDRQGKLDRIDGPTAGKAIRFRYKGFLEEGATTEGVLPSGGEIDVSRTFDDFLRVDSETVGGSTISFGYDDDSVLSSAGALTITRDPVHGLVTGTTLADGGHTITDLRLPTAFGEPDLYVAKRDGVEIFRIDYDPFDSRGQLRSKTETVAGKTHVYAYAYDDARRLSSSTRDGEPATIYTYDANGSRAGPGWGATDGQDRLPHFPVASAYTYTANGTLRNKTAEGQVTTYGYDLLGNLRSVQRPAPAAPIGYGIDGLNRRVSKSVGGVLQRAWAWDGARIAAEFDSAGNMTSRFVYGTRPHVPDYMIKGGQVYRLLTDHLGSMRLVVRLSDGAIAQELAYDPWGAVEKDTSPGLQPFGFAGGLYDKDTQLVRFGARDYDPAIGRWTAKDPSGLVGGMNLYAYAEDDPINLVDLTGEHPVVFMMLAGAMEGIGEDILFQMTVGGKRWGCLDGQELAIAGIMGAVSGGLGAPTARGGAGGLADLAKFRSELGLSAGEGTLARLDVGGKSFYGINAHGQSVAPLRVNAWSATHAEADAFAQAARQGVTGGTGRLFVDRPLCHACGTFGGVRSMARQLGLEGLEVITPAGTNAITL